MRNHTKEPWHVVDADFGDATTRYIDDEPGAEGGRDFYLATVEHGDQVELEANARRIVACVNACAGLSTGILERHPGKGAFEVIQILSKKNEELLDALKEASDALNAYCDLDNDSDLMQKISNAIEAG